MENNKKVNIDKNTMYDAEKLGVADVIKEQIQIFEEVVVNSNSNKNTDKKNK